MWPQGRWESGARHDEENSTGAVDEDRESPLDTDELGHGPRASFLPSIDPSPSFPRWALPSCHQLGAPPRSRYRGSLNISPGMSPHLTMHLGGRLHPLTKYTDDWSLALWCSRQMVVSRGSSRNPETKKPDEGGGRGGGHLSA